jgi:hypothetical protein
LSLVSLLRRPRHLRRISSAVSPERIGRTHRPSVTGSAGAGGSTNCQHTFSSPHISIRVRSYVKRNRGEKSRYSATRRCTRTVRGFEVLVVKYCYHYSQKK